MSTSPIDINYIPSPSSTVCVPASNPTAHNVPPVPAPTKTSNANHAEPSIPLPPGTQELCVSTASEISSNPVPTPVPLVPSASTQAFTPTLAELAVPSQVTSAAVESPQSPFSKPKKKKAPLPVSMTAVAMVTSTESAAGENTGRWTAEEHRLFLQGLELHGKGWKKIASLIKSRTVVQIRTHAQKYFQKLSKARQNGEEGEISMDSRGGPSAVAVGLATNGGLPAGKRRRHTTGTKRKAIASVVTSAHREGKKMIASQDASGVPFLVPHLPTVAPALAPFLVSTTQLAGSGANTPTTVPAIANPHSALSGPALEDSLFRFLTPAPVASETPVQVNQVARQAGANPITLPSDHHSAVPSAGGGEVSPHGVAEIAIFPSWTDAKDMPSWYQKGADVDALLDCADTLDWLADTGDLHEIYDPSSGLSIPQFVALSPATSCLPSTLEVEQEPLTKNSSVSNIAHYAMASDTDVDVPPLPSLFGSELASKRQRTSGCMLSTYESYASIDTSLDVFDTPMEEHAFVSALLENNCESSISLSALQ